MKPPYLAIFLVALSIVATPLVLLWLFDMVIR